MAVYIGQASIDENGGIHGGQAGNQSGRELNRSNWYNGGWTLLIRAKDPKTAEKMAKACEAGVANKNIGYDQWQRNTLRAEAKKVNWNLAAIKTPSETDCSAFMAVCAEAAGVNMDVAYTQGGFNPIPEDLKLAACMLVDHWHKQDYRQAKTIGGETVTFNSTKSGIPEHIRTIIEVYRRV